MVGGMGFWFINGVDHALIVRPNKQVRVVEGMQVKEDAFVDGV